MSNEISCFNIGSEWRKWDLHVHSPASEGFSGTWEQFETQLKNAECEVIGINDYFSVAGYKKIKEQIENSKLDIGNKKILPVVEFRMNESLQNKNTTTNSAIHFNFHIIFDVAIKIADIENLIKGLNSCGTKISSDYDDKTKLKDKKISLDYLLEELNRDEKFKDKFLLWLPYDEYGGIDNIDPNSDGWIKCNYIKRADILGSSRQKQIDFFLWKSELKTDGTPKFTQDQFLDWFLRKKACIKGSDSHSQDYPIGKLKDENSNPTEKYCWIKADPTFEGLKQIVYEPEARIFIGEEKPRKPVNTINSITLEIPNGAKVGNDVFCFAGNKNTYDLSPYLNCFIGGRGSGKSTILNFLGVSSNKPSASEIFWHGNRKDKKGMNPVGFDPCDSKIFSFQGAEYFEFLAQSEIETFARDKAAFTQAIYNRADARAGSILKEYENGIETKQKELDKIIHAIADLNGLENQKITKEKEKRNLENSINVLSSEEYKAVSSGITKKSKELHKYESWKKIINDFKISLDELILGFDSKNIEKCAIKKTEYEKTYELAFAKICEAAKLLTDGKFSEEEMKESEIKASLNELENRAKIILEKTGLSQENVEQMKSAPQKIIYLDGEIKNISEQISERNKTILTFSQVIEKLNFDRQNYEKKIIEILKPLQELLEKQFKENNGKDIKKISLEYSFDEDSAWNALAYEFYDYFKPTHKGSERGNEVCSFIAEHKDVFSSNILSKITNILQHDQTNNQKYIKFIDEVFKEQNNFQIFQAIRDKHLYDIKINKIIHVKYDNRDVEHASFGQRCAAVIVILLLFGNYPLIIDEPETHLDSLLIANYLVPLLKKKKLDRQIIFSTHNANFVINGDSEKIFILKNENGQTEIIETTIENKKNREELLKLEGGKKAFKKRGEKLSIKV